jgi:nucleoside-diphosphate-sugar epimerase
MAERPASVIAPPILVTGGTGTLGRLVVARLRNAGRDIRVLSRGQHPEGKRTEIILLLAGSAKGDDDEGRHLVRPAFAAGANLTPDRAIRGRTWEQFLASRLSPSAANGLAMT